MAGLPREVLKWLQSLDLTWQIKTPKWDLTNGFLVAEIFSWYYPNDIHMNYFNTGDSFSNKESNWITLKKFVRKQKLDIPVEVMDANLHCKEAAARVLIEILYEQLTKRTIRRPEGTPALEDMTFTDQEYQSMLPIHARSTAVQTIRNNLKATELFTISDAFHSQQLAQEYIDMHIERRKQERQQNPARFQLRPTLGERCIRRPPPAPRTETDSSDMLGESTAASDESFRDGRGLSGLIRNSSHGIKEVRVKQMMKGVPIR